MYRQVKLAMQAAIAMAAEAMDGSVTHTIAKGGGRNSGAASHRGGA